MVSGNNKKIFLSTLVPLILSIIGASFLIYYIFRASTDVVASDYIRIINNYIVDVEDLESLWSWEAVSRIPFTFLARYINVKLFNYSVYFDKILGIFGLFIFNFVTVKYVLENIGHRVFKYVISIMVTLVSFSLMAWEMILNGTGYPHFITVGLMSLTFYVGTKIADSQTVGASISHYIINTTLIFVTSLLFAGNYAVTFLATIIIFSIIDLIMARKRYCGNFTSYNAGEKSQSKAVKLRGHILSKVLTIIISLICFAIYFKSSSTGEQILPVGFQDITLKELLAEDLLFPVKFLICSFASALVGVETITYAIAAGSINANYIYIFGSIYLIIVVWTIATIAIKIYKYFNNKKTTAERAMEASDFGKEIDLFPLYYIVCGLINFTLVFLARYKFVRVDYGMQSRYAIQYMFLTIGVILVLARYIDKIISSKTFEKKRIIASLISAICILILFMGHLVTTEDEIMKSDSRKILYSQVEDVAKNYKGYDDETLMNTFEYRRSAEHIRDALAILENNHLNIFK